MESYAKEHRFPIIGPVCGQLCYQVARMIRAKRVFELGSGFGYSTAWFAKAVEENGGGRIHHVVWDENLSKMARGHLERLGYSHLIEYKVGEAVAALREATGSFDIVFCDIDKHGYPDALSVAVDMIRPGGLFIADNSLWHGDIFDAKDTSADTEGIRRFNDAITRDTSRWIASLIPIRDGLMVAMRK